MKKKTNERRELIEETLERKLMDVRNDEPGSERLSNDVDAAKTLYDMVHTDEKDEAELKMKKRSEAHNRAVQDVELALGGVALTGVGALGLMNFVGTIDFGNIDNATAKWVRDVLYSTAKKIVFHI